MYDKPLAERVRTQLGNQPALEEKAMFGGLGFLSQGNLVVAVWKSFLIVRVGAPAYEEALREPGAREFDITGQAMTGWVLVDSAVLVSEEDLAAWLQRATTFAATLSPKSAAEES